MKYMPILVFAAITAIPLIGSVPAHTMNKCDRAALADTNKRMAKCKDPLNTVCITLGYYGESDVCYCCKYLFGGSSSVPGYNCCVIIRDNLDNIEACSREDGGDFPDNCHLNSTTRKYPGLGGY